MGFFKFLAKNISYTFAVAFFTVIFGSIATVFGMFLGTSFIIISYDKLLAILIKWFPISVLIVSLIHFIQMGFLTPIKVPALFRSHRQMNRIYRSNMEVGMSELKSMYSNFTDFILHNTLAAVIYAILTGGLIIAFAYYEMMGLKTITEPEYMVLIKVSSLSTMIVVIIYGVSTYLITETLTIRERAQVYNELLKKGVKLGPRILIGIRVKFLFFVVLMIITLFTFAALMERSHYYDIYRMEYILGYFSLSIVTTFVLMQINSNSIVRLLSDLRRVTSAIASGGKADFEVLSLEREFAQIEFGLMEMAWEIDDYRKQLETMVQQRTNELQNALTDLRGRDNLIQKQLDMASVIQRSIIPEKIDDWNELKFSARYIAMEKIGGDFYDIYQLKDDKIGLMVADVSGHGIPAALVTTMAKITFGNTGTKYDSPRRIFQEVNQSILDHVKTQDYMTCFFVAIDDEYNVTYSNASHQKAILLRTDQGETELLDTGGLFIGAVEEARDTYEEKTTKLNYGDRMVLYTDGIPEAVNSKREDYTNERLEKAVRENRNLPLDEFSSAIIADVQKHIGNSELEDDLTLLVIELSRDEAVDIVKNSKKLLNTHQYYEAIQLLENGLIKHPDNQKILYNLTKNYFRVNNYSRAIQYVEKYIENDKRNKYAFYLCGASYYQMLDFKTAVDNFDKALELDPNFVNALFAQGMSYKKMGSRDAAVKIFERVINLDTDNKMALFELKLLKEKK